MGDPIFAAPVRTRADGADERIQTKITGNSSSVLSGAASHQAIVDVSGLHVVVDDIVGDTVINAYGAISALGAGSETAILTYTVPVLQSLFLSRIEASGDNISLYNVYKNASKIATKRTYFGGDLNVDFEFSAEPNRGLLFAAGDVITVKVIHSRPSTADYESRLVGILR